MLHRVCRGASAAPVQRSFGRNAIARSAPRTCHFSSSTARSSFPNEKKRTTGTASLFLDAKAACKGKDCVLEKGSSNIGADPATCGEDSFFITPEAVGVADGVGGWNENGVDPGKISRSLMRNAAAFVRKQKANNNSASTQQMLTYGYNQAVLDDEVEAGSTTACIVRLKHSSDGKPVLEYSNLGDSGFVVIRRGEIIFRSQFQVGYKLAATDF